MSQEGYANSVMNDGPRLHSNVPISELTERVTQAIETSDVSSAPLVARNCGRGNAKKLNRPLPKPNLAQRLKIPKNCLGYARRQDL